MKRDFYTIVLLAVVFAFTGCKQKTESAPEVKCVNIATAEDEASLAPYSYSGKTKSPEDCAAAFRVSGQLISVKVKEGDYVRKGQVIAEMDPRDYNLQLNATTAEYQQIKADCERVIAMYNEGNTTAQNYDKARYGLEQITQKLNNHRNQLNDTKLKAPISGYVQSKFHEAGETVGAGMPIVSIFGNSDIEVEINLPASDYAVRDSFYNYTCSFDIFPGKRFGLQVIRCSQEANRSQLYTMRLRLVGDYERKKITPGMSTMVYVNKHISGRELISIPSSAVMFKDDKVMVFVYDEKTKKVKLRPIVLNALLKNGTALVVEGLKYGEKVVSTGIHHIKDGDEVEIIKPVSKSNIGGLL